MRLSRTEYDRLDVLINNAGVMCHPQAQTADHYEVHFQTNYLGQYATVQLIISL